MLRLAVVGHCLHHLPQQPNFTMFNQRNRLGEWLRYCNCGAADAADLPPGAEDPPPGAVDQPVERAPDPPPGDDDDLTDGVEGCHTWWHVGCPEVRPGKLWTPYVDPDTREVLWVGANLGKRLEALLETTKLPGGELSPEQKSELLCQLEQVSHLLRQHESADAHGHGSLRYSTCGHWCSRCVCAPARSRRSASCCPASPGSATIGKCASLHATRPTGHLDHPPTSRQHEQASTQHSLIIS